MSNFMRAGKVGTVAALGAGALVFLAPQAGAWHASLEATPVCVGAIPTINWTVTESVKGGVVTITDNYGHTSVGASSGVLTEAAGTTSVTITLNVKWSNGVKSDSSTTVTFPDGCGAVTTTTTTAPTTTTSTTTVPPTTSTTASTTTTTLPASTTTTTVPGTTSTTAPHTSPTGGTTTSTTTDGGSTTTIPGSTTTSTSTTVPVQPSTSPASGAATPAVPATLTDGPSSTGLAFTGYNAEETGGIGGLLITGGVVALWVARRRYAAKHLKK